MKIIAPDTAGFPVRSPDRGPLPIAHDPFGDPLASLADGGVLAIITGIEGPHYRNPGAIMAFPRKGGAVGQLSSGCIEADLALHARDVAADGRVRRLRYGTGSPFVDLVLPCGGGLDIALVRVDDPAPVRACLAARDARTELVLGVDLDQGTVALNGPGFALRVAPPPRFLTWGAGVEAVTFAALARAAGYPSELTTHDDATAAAAQVHKVPQRPPGPVHADRWTAITLFYHDHDRELPVLVQALDSDAFYIGAQGSLRAHRARVAALQDLGASDAALARLRGPIGVIPSAREPRVLAISVLAEIMAEAAG